MLDDLKGTWVKPGVLKEYLAVEWITFVISLIIIKIKIFDT